MSTTKLDLPENQVDMAWCSEACKRKILDEIVKKYPCKQKFSKIEVIPLYATALQRFYRVTLWVNDWSSDSLGPIKVVWKAFHVILEGIERKIVSIEEDDKKKLKLSENGRKFMKEMGISDIE
jgi:hypothetical protein